MVVKKSSVKNKSKILAANSLVRALNTITYGTRIESLSNITANLDKILSPIRQNTSEKRSTIKNTQACDVDHQACDVDELCSYLKENQRRLKIFCQMENTQSNFQKLLGTGCFVNQVTKPVISI